MTEAEIIKKWRQGVSKDKLTKIYKREYNMNIKIVRSTVRHRHSGKFITNKEALRIIENTIYRYLKQTM